jgi:hypothetical protein
MTDVHTEHCCLKHGCKYRDDDCTVVTGKAPQSFKCETCLWEEEDPTYQYIERLEDALIAAYPQYSTRCTCATCKLIRGIKEKREQWKTLKHL